MLPARMVTKLSVHKPPAAAPLESVYPPLQEMEVVPSVGAITQLPALDPPALDT